MSCHLEISRDSGKLWIGGQPSSSRKFTWLLLTAPTCIQT